MSREVLTKELVDPVEIDRGDQGALSLLQCQTCLEVFLSQHHFEQHLAYCQSTGVNPDVTEDEHEQIRRHLIYGTGLPPVEEEQTILEPPRNPVTTNEIIGAALRDANVRNGMETLFDQDHHRVTSEGSLTVAGPPVCRGIVDAAGGLMEHTPMVLEMRSIAENFAPNNSKIASYTIPVGGRLLFDVDCDVNVYVQGLADESYIKSDLGIIVERADGSHVDRIFRSGLIFFHPEHRLDDPRRIERQHIVIPGDNIQVWLTCQERIEAGNLLVRIGCHSLRPLTRAPPPRRRRPIQRVARTRSQNETEPQRIANRFRDLLRRHSPK